MIADVLPTPAAGSIEQWLLAAAAIGYIVLIGKKLFVRKPPIEVDFVMKTEFHQFKTDTAAQIQKIENKMDTTFLRLADKLEDVKTEILTHGERRGASIHERLNEVESAVARIDERTRR
jgi:hypothetical protein